MGSMLKFLISDNFLIPFLSTSLASFTVLFVQFINRYIREKRHRLYAISYIADVYFRMLFTDLFLIKNTILPHIEATKRIIKGDGELLEMMFLTDEFDILTDDKTSFFGLSEELKILVGNDDIEVIQMFETILYSSTQGNKNAFNSFVRQNLKSAHQFMQKNSNEQLDCLNTYWDYLSKIQSSYERTVFTIYKMGVPRLEKYKDEYQFLLFPFSKRSINNSIKKINKTLGDYRSFLPPDDFMKKKENSGIKNAL